MVNSFSFSGRNFWVFSLYEEGETSTFIYSEGIPFFFCLKKKGTRKVIKQEERGFVDGLTEGGRR